jgi:hypothetical protein
MPLGSLPEPSGLPHLPPVTSGVHSTLDAISGIALNSFGLEGN